MVRLRSQAVSQGLYLTIFLADSHAAVEYGATSSSFFASLAPSAYQQTVPMTPLVHVVLSFRRHARASVGYVAVLALSLLIVLGIFDRPEGDLGLEHWAVISAWMAVFGAKFGRRLRMTRGWEQSDELPEPDSSSPVSSHATSNHTASNSKTSNHTSDERNLDIQLSLLAVVGTYAIVQLAGGLSGVWYPLVYVLISLVACCATHPAAGIAVAFAIVLEGVTHFWTDGSDDWPSFLTHALFVGLFGALGALVMRAEVTRVRVRSRTRLREERERLRTESRLFRLVSPSSEVAHDEQRLCRASVDEVHHQLYYVLELLHRCLDLHTCVLLMLDEQERQLRIVELVTVGKDIAEGPFAAGEGAVGAVVRRAEIVNLQHIKEGYGGLCYYAAPPRVRAFVGVPVVERGHIRGVLCADRIRDEPFTAHDEETIRTSIRQVLRALENERVFVQLESSKREQTVLYQASKALGAALDEAAVLDAALAAISKVAPYDFAALTIYDVKHKRHHVRRAVGDGAEQIEELSFRDNASLTAMAVKNKHYLPYRGEFDGRQQVLFTRRAVLPAMKSVLVLPLIVREDAIGTLALAARAADVFGERVRPSLQVLANQCAVSLSNAAAVARLEEMATTDGLTGCLNKRSFLDELQRRIRSAERFGRRMSLIVTDIDHFKSVNDTYGHATGDVVIRKLGEILRRVKRETDLVARFGGEEFCILCEETDTQGAVLLAERVREELGATEFQTELGSLHVRASLGVATFPDHAQTCDTLFECADRALYAAKRGGRDQVRAA